MKDSGIAWIGEIPKEWKIGRFKNICKIKSGDSLSNELICDEDIYPVYGGGTDSLGYYNKYNTYSEEIIVGRVGARCGCVSLPKCKCWATDNALIVHTNLDVVFSYYLLCGFDLNRLNTSNAQPLITSSKINDSFICIPPLSEQQRIATFLDEKCKEIDALIALQEEMITELQAYKQSVISEAVTKGLNPKVTMKDSGVEWIGEIPEDWDFIRLRYLCDINTGNQDTINKVDNGLYPFFVRSPKVERINSYEYDGEAVLMAGDGVGAGKVFHYYNGKFNYHQRVYNFHKFRKITGKYLYYYMPTKFGYKIEEGGAKSTVDSVRLPWLKDFFVCVPPLPEQQAIANYLDTQCTRIDSLIALKQAKIESLKEYKKSVIYEYVTGKKEVPATV